MKKQFHKIKIAAEHFSRSNKSDKNSDDLLKAEKQVDKYKDVLEKVSKKFSVNTSSIGQDQDQAAREKRCKKVHEYRLAQSMEESLKDIPDGLLKEVLENCAKLEKTIASEIINNEISVENDVTKRLLTIMDNHVPMIQKQKRIVTKLTQDYESAKYKHQAAIKINENQTKINQLKEEQDECESKLEKERDIWAAEMFELIAEEENISNYIINYIKFQQLYYKSALKEIETVMDKVNGLLKDNNKRVFKVPLEDHLLATGRSISYVIELCVCCLLEKGLYEEGLLRVGCAGTKLRRMRTAIDANLIGPPLPSEYQDVHVIAGVLKSYLRDLPDPLLTYRLYNEFISAAQRPSEVQRKKAILNAVNQLPEGHYYNLRYLTKFLSYLSQKNTQNKMPSQNIAIVMSPNLLWPPNQNDSDYAQNVNSTAAVNTIVEAIVADWEFFFDGEIDFYVSMSRDDLFPDNGGFPYDRETQQHHTLSSIDHMSKSMNAASSATTASTIMSSSMSGNGSSGGGGVAGVGNNNIMMSGYQTHSRSSSHDTSLILLDQTKRSQSNSSLSDQSSPPHGSPKLPIRRKHNKQAAPTPPDQKRLRPEKIRLEKTNSDSSQKNLDEHFQSGLVITKIEAASQTPGVVKTTDTQRHLGSIENLNKPEKPPRPVMSVECQTLNRLAYKTSKCGLPNKPVALPRSTINQAFIKNEQNYPNDVNNKNKSDDEEIMFREKSLIDDKSSTNNSHLHEKPVVPERPASLARPISYKGSLQEVNQIPSNLQSESNNFNQYGNGTNSGSNGSGTGVKKTQSFRVNSTGSIKDNGQTVLERTHIYNVDKQQVAIIDVGDNSNNNKYQTRDNLHEIDKLTESSITSLGNIGSVTSGSGTITTPTSPNSLENAIDLSQVPPSPRGFDPKVKRPQVPAPPPPNRPKSDGGAGDSTNL